MATDFYFQVNSEARMNFCNNSTVGVGAVVAAATLLLSGCTINIGGGSPEAEADDMAAAPTSTQTIENAADEFDESGGSAEDKPEGGYLPELGDSELSPGSADAFEPCNEVPQEFYERLGISGLEVNQEFDSMNTCGATVEGNGSLSITGVSFGLELIEGNESSTWSQTSAGVPILVMDNSIESFPSCSAAVGTRRGTIMVGYYPQNSDEAPCPQAEHYLRSILAADGKDDYNG